MFQFDENLESLFAQCIPFDESPLHHSEDYIKTSQTLRAARHNLHQSVILPVLKQTLAAKLPRPTRLERKAAAIFTAHAP